MRSDNLTSCLVHFFIYVWISVPWKGTIPVSCEKKKNDYSFDNRDITRYQIACAAVMSASFIISSEYWLC